MFKLWWETIVGIFHTAPSEHLAILVQDVSYGLRMLRKNSMFALLAILTLTLGIGANTAIFSVLRSVLLRPLPYRDGQQIVVLHQPTINVPDVSFSVSEKTDYSAAQSFSDVVEYHNMNFTILGNGTAERVKTGVVSAGFFGMFGVKPILGRTFRFGRRQTWRARSSSLQLRILAQESER
jgi:putative ABC transport system permease protein